ncbi:hypothetical protein K7711_04815 [Nocardia sp. CA2R105]|uniref:AfsR/SARP family transcriptional regulator n=1 Tax=Nocardia coffeae TaxID=2873381 RepID=UPI001CA673A6|nr:BTAD domain-containing putative transcriptional regulator [Nocardia coffeae]MBY8855792.1 hypothetical protein [Nocardia coffeae]
MLTFAVLGEVRAWRGDHPLDLGPKQRRAVLAALLLRCGRSATVRDLVADVWGEQATASAVGALRNHVLHLRKVLEPERAAGSPPTVLVGFDGGYALRLPPGAVDTELADRYAAEAERAADAEQARERLQAALVLWAGPPLAGIPGPFAERLRVQLSERRLSLLERRLETDLRLGRFAAAIGELHPLSSEHPLREKIRELLMTALYHAGRQAEALEVYADTRRTLIDSLGIEPGPLLTDLHERILRADLAPVRSPVAVAEPVSRVAQLPADIADFTGREEQVRRLTERLTDATGAVAVCAIAGMGGVGKSTLAVHVAHRVREHFRDGQLHTDLHGAAQPGDILGDFLRALGVPEGKIAATPDQRAAQFRSLLDGRRVLVLLDNARDADQVIPLIPGTAGSAVLITSRAAMPELAGASSVRLDEMSEAEALALLGGVVGAERVAAEPDSAEAVVRSCGRLPLAVRIIGARLATRPRWSIASIAERLADEQQRLAVLRTGDLAVGAVFRVDYDQLEPAQAEAVRMLSVPEVEDLSLPGAAAVLDMSRDEAELLCETLVDLSLLDAPAPGRYTYHDLLRLFARELMDPADEPAALRRLLEFYLATMKNVVAVSNPGTRLPEHLSRTRVQGLSFSDGVGAQGWLNAERPNLVRLFGQIARRSAARDSPGVCAELALCADLAWAMAELIDGGPNAQELSRALEELLEAALRAGDRGLECRVRVALGSVLTYSLARMRIGRDHQRIALSLGSDDPGDARLTAFAAQLLAGSTRQGHESAASLAHVERAMRIARRVGDPAIECAALVHAAKTLSDAGRYLESAERARAGWELAEQIGNLALAGMALHEQGAALAFLGEFERGAELCARAVESAHRSGSQLRVGFALARHAQVCLLVGALDRAESIAAEAVDTVTRAAGPLHRARIMLLHATVLGALGRTEDEQRVLRATAEIVSELEDTHLVHERVDAELEAPVVAILHARLAGAAEAAR